jgi:hypothetical protein
MIVGLLFVYAMLIWCIEECLPFLCHTFTNCFVGARCVSHPFCRSNVSADVRLVGGWLFRQLLPHGEDEFTAFHLRRLKVHPSDIMIPYVFLLGRVHWR